MGPPESAIASSGLPLPKVARELGAGVKTVETIESAS
jgi:hypothetical protein